MADEIPSILSSDLPRFAALRFEPTDNEPRTRVVLSFLGNQGPALPGIV